MANIIPFEKLRLSDLESVGGKNSSLGEMIHHLTDSGVKVPQGFATTADAFLAFLAQDDLDNKIYDELSKLDVQDIAALARTGKTIRQWILDTPFSPDLETEITEFYNRLNSNAHTSVAIRSSATSEDLPEASFAGQQETYLNIRGIDNVLNAIKAVFASLFTDRAIAYRVHHKFDHSKVSLSVGIQKMVRSDRGVSGVMFTLDTESGFDQVVLINASYGLGEGIVAGKINPDEFYVHKPSLKAGKFPILRRTIGEKSHKMVYGDDQHHQNSLKLVDVSNKDRSRFCLNDDDIQKLAHYALLIEDHYGFPMDIEWAKDGLDGEIYILQARPETVKSREPHNVIERYSLKETSDLITSGRSVGQRIGRGTSKLIANPSEMGNMEDGDVLVTDMTDPDWEPIMKRAAAIVTDRGGRTCHAAIIAREMGIPAVVGCGNATELINHGDLVTVSCAEGEEGHIYKGILDFEVKQTEIATMPTLPFNITMNLGNPDLAFTYQAIPNAGVGLARIEFIISKMIGIHPNALFKFDELPDDLKDKISDMIAAYPSPLEYYIERLKEGIATIAAAFYPKPIIVRFSDFKSNEYANLVGGNLFEPEEENPMLGYRGASRYVSDQFRECFELECQAIWRVREDMGLTNTQVMVPFTRTVDEAKQVIDVLGEFGLKRGENDLNVYMMCEIPSNALLAEEFLELFDGFSIGSNDLTQLTLGLDRDSNLVANLFDERNAAVKKLLEMAISACHKKGKYVGICGQGPSDHPDFAKWLMEQGINSVSLVPDSIIETWLYLSTRE